MSEVAWIADRSGDAEQAEWLERALRACAGAAPHLAEKVVIRRVTPRGGFAGGAVVHDRVVVRLDLRDDASDTILAHEIAHAWAPVAADFIGEGVAGALGTCAMRAMSGVRARASCDPGVYRALPADVRGWQRCAEAACGGDDAARREMEAVYAASEQYMRALLDAGVPVTTFVSADGVADWDRLDAAAIAVGHAELVDATHAADPSWLGWLLSDVDCDGQPRASELRAGTDPDRWDSNGDGWWDGAHPRTGWIPLPPDGFPVCLSGTADTTATWVRVWSDLDATGAVRLGGGPPLGPGSHLVFRPGPLVGRVLADGTGGGAAVWVDAASGPLCRSSVVFTVWTDEPALAADVARVFDASVGLEKRAAVRLVSTGDFAFERPGYTVVVPLDRVPDGRTGPIWVAALAEGWRAAAALDNTAAVTAAFAWADQRAGPR